MMRKSFSKPFYLQPPWNVLFDLNRLQKVNPWDVSISFLLLSFLEEMDKRAEIDFRASGVALDSSATLFLMKSKLLFRLGEPPAPSKSKPDFIPPPMILPIRYELTTTTIKNLLEALDKVLEGERLLALKTPPRQILPPPPEVVPTISAYLMRIEEQIERLTQEIRSLAERGQVVTFSKLANGLRKLGKIKVFTTLLFMAQKGKVTLWQGEEFDEIYITLN